MKQLVLALLAVVCASAVIAQTDDTQLPSLPPPAPESGTSPERPGKIPAPVSPNAAPDTDANTLPVPAQVVDEQTPVPELEPPSARAPQPSPLPQPPPLATDREILDQLGEAELRGILNMVKDHYVGAPRLSETELARARIQGLLARESPAMKLIASGDTSTKFRTTEFKAAALRELGYARLGELNESTLERLDTAIRDFQKAGITVVALDLRASGASGDANIAAAILRRFLPQGIEMFRLSKVAPTEDRLFTSTSKPLHAGPIVLLVDHDTRGAAELVATVLAAKRDALIVGERTAGELFEYAEVTLKEGHTLRYAVAQVLVGDTAISPGKGLEPHIPVATSPDTKWRRFDIADRDGVAATVFEKERPRMNEAALVAGRNPELAQLEEISNGREDRLEPDPAAVFDLTLQRAVDLAATLPVLGPKPETP